MDEIEIDTVATPEIEDPLFVEGLPGVGLVGKLAVDHLISECESQPVTRVYSEHFPPAISVDGDGMGSLPSLSVHAIETDARDLLVLAGEAQAQEAVGQYRLAGATLDIAQSFGVNQVVTLGGFGTGEEVDDYDVIGAASARSEDLRERLEAAGVSFEREGAPGNIVGMSGLLVGLGAREGFETAGLLGLTPGYHVDPGSARAVLDVLQAAFDFSVSLETLDDQAEHVHELLQRIQEIQQRRQEPSSSTSGEDLRYFG